MGMLDVVDSLVWSSALPIATVAVAAAVGIFALIGIISCMKKPVSRAGVKFYGSLALCCLAVSTVGLLAGLETERDIANAHELIIELEEEHEVEFYSPTLTETIETLVIMKQTENGTVQQNDVHYLHEGQMYSAGILIAHSIDPSGAYTISLFNTGGTEKFTPFDPKTGDFLSQKTTP